MTEPRPDVPVRTRREAVELVARWCAQLDELDWGGRSDVSARACAEGLATFAVERGGIRFAASIDEIAVEAGVHRETARRACQRLEDHHRILERERGGGGASSASWRLRFVTQTPTGGRAPATWMGQDWARYRALGKRAGIVLEAVLGTAPGTIRTVHGWTPRTFRRTLDQLVKLGVLEVRDGVWWCNGDLARWAELYGTDGVAARERTRLATKRERENARRVAWWHPETQPTVVPQGDDRQSINRCQ